MLLKLGQLMLISTLAVAVTISWPLVQIDPRLTLIFSISWPRISIDGPTLPKPATCDR